MQYLDRLHPERLDPVEDPLAGAEQDRSEIERELVYDSRGEGLPYGRGTARDVHALLFCGFERLRIGRVEPAGYEVEGRPALHLDRLASVMGEHEHRGVIRRLGS